jgi:hypothetical protein
VFGYPAEYKTADFKANSIQDGLPAGPAAESQPLPHSLAWAITTAGCPCERKDLNW